ncbi:MAG: twin-arginine translocase TatA/TatE family subunit [Gemmatimonadetes bacterium]|nr:twin-arginine translocase TatA/TatE family subunit [Gemmatimonadota bacterium]
MPFNFGPVEMIVMLLVVLLVFGAKRLPEIGTSLGKGIREFKSSIREVESSVRVDKEIAAPPQEKPLPREPEAQDEGTPRRLTTG